MGKIIGLSTLPPRDLLHPWSPLWKRLTNPACLFLLPWLQQLVGTEAKHLSSSKSRVVLAPVSRGPDACQTTTRAQLGQDPPQRTVLGVLTENAQYRKTCDQVMTKKHWERALLSWGEVGFSLSFAYKLSLSIPTLESVLLGH